MNRLLDITICLWLLFVAVAFWSAYGLIPGVALPPNILTAIYAVFLLVAIVRLTLNWLQHKQK